MKVQTRLILLIILCAALAVSSIGVFYKVESDRLKSIFLVESRKLELQTDMIIALVNRSIETFVDDYTFWDDMVRFVTARDPVWGQQNIEVSLSTFKGNVAWVYTPDGSLAYSVSDEDGRAVSVFPVPSSAIRTLFADSPFCHFFVMTPSGLFEIRGATIHPSADVKRITPPAGSFFVGKIWKQPHIALIEELISAKMTVERKAEGHAVENRPRAGIITFHRPLKGWDGRTAAVLHITGKSEPVRIFNALSRITFFIIIWLAVVIIIALAVFLTWWIFIPLTAILRTLFTEDPVFLAGLLASKDEFGRIAGLMKRFFLQRKQLVAEVAARKITEAKLERSNERFTKAFHSNPGMMTISKLDNGALIDVNDAFIEATGHTKEELIGHSTVELGILTPEMRARFTDLLRKKQAVRNVVIEMVSKSGVKHICLFSAELMAIDNEAIMIGVSIDITERKHAEEALEHKIRELERFNKLAVGREVKMIELKEKIKELEERLEKRS